MKISEIKKEMLKHRDFYGGDIIYVEEINKAKSKKELAKIIEDHRSHQEAMLSDASSTLDIFKRKLGLHIL